MNDCISYSWGVQRGDFDPDTNSARHLARLIEHHRGDTKWSKVFAPSCAFTNRIAALGEDDYFPDSSSTWFVRTAKNADGGIVEEPEMAVMFFNADCPIVTIYDGVCGRLAVLHAGLRCLVPDAIFDRRADKKQKRSIIQVCFDDFDFRAGTAEVSIGYGIGPCCYGIEHRQDLLQTASVDIPIGRTTRGPRSNPPQRSVDLYELALRQLLNLGVPRRRIEIDSCCTSCYLHKGLPVYHSNVRSGPGSTSRNAAFAWFLG